MGDQETFPAGSCNLPIKDRAHAGTVSAAPMNMEACRQQDAVFYCDGAMRERSNQELIPA